MRYQNTNIPPGAHDKIVALTDHPAAFAMGHDGAWVLVEPGAGVISSGAQSAAADATTVISTGDPVQCLAITADGSGWAVSSQASYVTRGIAEDCDAYISLRIEAGDPPHWIALAPGGGWVVLCEGGWQARRINDACAQAIRNLRQDGRVDVVQFTSDGGWAVINGLGYVAQGLDSGCVADIAQFCMDGDQISSLAFTGAGDGWSILSASSMPTSSPSPLRTAEGSVASDTIWQAMQETGIAGASIAVVQNNQVTATAGYGWLQAGASHAAHPESVFQAASISKLVTALGVLRLVDDGVIALNEDVRPYLNWSLPQRFSTAVDKVSFRSLLRHVGGVTAGAAGSGGGFAGYQSGLPVPSLVEILDGVAPPANSQPIRLTSPPRTVYSYSGAGFVLLQRAIEEITGTGFSSWMQTNVLGPLDMSSSTFDPGPPSGLVPADEVASGHLRTGDRIPGLRNRYPELAAAGLYSTALDLSRIAIMINQSGVIDGEQFLSTSLINQMLSPSNFPNGTTNVGLGCSLPQRQVGQCWKHDGDNEGFSCSIFGVPARSGGLVVMTNGDWSNNNARDVRTEIVNAVLAAYGW